MRSINRIASSYATALFLKTPIHPNHITLLSALAGILAFFAFCRGTKAGSILGAIFFEAFYVLDNCDGEVARVRGMVSAFGGWLDTLVDYLIHVLAFAGITLGVFRATLKPIVLLVGAAATMGVFLSFFVVVMQKARNYGLAVHGMPKAPGGAARRVSFLDKLVDAFSIGDFSLLLLLFAIFGKLELILWLGAVGANLFCAVLLILNFKYLIDQNSL